MIFTELRFLFFFAAVFAVHWSLRNDTARKVWLLGASWAFYAAWDARFLALIWTSTIVDYLVAAGLARTDRERRRRWLLAISLAVNLGMLGYFKYAGFFVDSAEQFLEWLGLPVSRSSLQIMLPVGISFYTFQTLSYTIDVYRRRLTAERNLLNVALFVGFFPQLVAGPIVRAADFLPQLHVRRRLANVDAGRMVTLFAVGFFQKAVVGDNLADIIDPYFADPNSYDWLSSVAAVTGFSVQLYADFAGYSLMAIASAGLLGYTLPTNFEFPYLARNVSEFWRRWHITLGRWVSLYVYIPLGGNRGSPARVHLNLFLTMVVVGLWHGASWMFVIYGATHGAAMIIQREWSARRGEPTTTAAVVAGTALMFVFLALARVLFRSPDMTTATAIYTSLLQPFHDGVRLPDATLVLAGLTVLFAIHVANHRGTFDRFHTLPAWQRFAVIGGATPIAYGLMPQATTPFIYFQF